MAEQWDISQELAKDIRAVTIAVSYQVLKEEQGHGFTKDPRVVVDSRKFDAPVESVKPFGRVEFLERAELSAIVEFIWKTLVQRSPYKTGRYSDSHLIMVNGKEVDYNNLVVKPTDKVQIVNTQPYARKIERGLSDQAPTGVYRVVVNLARRKYGKLAFIQMKYVNLNLGVTIPGRRTLKDKLLRRDAGRVAQFYPCIQITPSKGTII